MIIRVSAGIILNRGKVLIAQRRYPNSLGGMWEFPGGKQEAGETAEQCLARELYEELSLEAEKFSYFDSSFYEYGSKRILISAFIVGRFGGILQSLDHNALAWISIPEIQSYPLAPADVPLARRLADRMP